jgi:hypothetical protein
MSRLYVAVLILLVAFPISEVKTSEIAFNADRLTVTVDGREVPIIIDYPECPDRTDCVDSAEFRQAIIDDIKGGRSRSEVYLWYERFDVYIDSVYYYSNTPTIDELFDFLGQNSN